MEISCKYNDAQLFKAVSTVHAALQLKKTSFQLEEIRINDSFLYYFDNPRTKSTGYIGREVGKKRLSYVGIDNSRISWALLEGFTREQAFEQCGALMKFSSLDDFIIFASGGKEYIIKDRFSKDSEDV